MSMLTGYALAEVDNLCRDIHALNAKIREIREYRQNDAQRIVDLEYELDQFVAHLKSEKARTAYLMDLLDKAYGADKNPARQQAYADADAMRILSGDRKGEVVTKADHVYLSKFAEVFKGSFASAYKHCKSWKDMLHSRITY